MIELDGRVVLATTEWLSIRRISGPSTLIPSILNLYLYSMIALVATLPALLLLGGNYKENKLIAPAVMKD